MTLDTALGFWGGTKINISYMLNSFSPGVAFLHSKSVFKGPKRAGIQAKQTVYQSVELVRPNLRLEPGKCLLEKLFSGQGRRARIVGDC